MIYVFYLILILIINSDLLCLHITYDYYKYPTEKILKIISQYLPKNPIILEAGSRFGEDTIKMSNFWPKSLIHAFEPLPQSYKILRQTTSTKKNIICYPLALSNISGRQCFYVSSKNPGASSLLKPNNTFNNNIFDSEIEVETIKFSEWLNNYNIQKIDFIWFDLEGAELIVLKDCEEILKSVKVIFTEMNFKEFRYGTAMFPQINEFLISKGFKEVWRREIKGHQGDSIYVKNYETA